MRIVCLANSRKLSGRCIAGKQWNEHKAAGKWIRPVSSRPTHEVSENERQFRDGSDPRLLDIIDVPILRSRPDNIQTENWLFDPDPYWKKVGTYPQNDLQALVDPVEPLWLDGHSTNRGCNDKIPIGDTAGLSGSLRFVSVDQVTLSVSASGGAFGNSKRRVQGEFTHAGQRYALWVTDPDYERLYLKEKDGAYRIGGCYLTISVGEEFKGSVYKLIAAIIPRMTILTIGHSNHSIEHFIGLLKRHSVDAVADVRSTPYGRYCPQFNRETLSATLKNSGIKYVYLGNLLGGRSEDSAHYDEDGRIRYDKLADTEDFRRGKERILRGAKDYRIAMMCAEKEPLDCHRTLLVGQELLKAGANVEHILPNMDDEPEPHTKAMQRLVGQFEKKLSVDVQHTGNLLGNTEPKPTEGERVDKAVAWKAKRVGHQIQSTTGR